MRETRAVVAYEVTWRCLHVALSQPSRGYVCLGKEIWQAEGLHPQEESGSGTPVVVRGTRGLTLLVEPEGTAVRPE